VVQACLKRIISCTSCGVTIVTRTTTTRLIAEQLPNLNNRKRTRLDLEPNLHPERSLWPSCLLFKEINSPKRQLKTEKTTSCNKRMAESILSTEVYLI
jgi:hypothetical protein